MPKPFPHIPRFDNEPLAEGPPRSAQESIFLSVPQLGKIADLAVEFNQSNSDKRRQITESLTGKFLDDPAYLMQSFDALALLQEIQSYKSQLFEEKLREVFGQRLERSRFGAFPPKPETLEAWLTVATESDVYRPIAEQALRQMFKKCKDVKPVVDLAYELALGGFRSSNPNVVKKTLEIFSYATDILPPDSRQAVLEMLGHFDPDDQTLQKSMEVDGALTFLTAVVNPGLEEIKRRAIGVITSQELFIRRMGGLMRQNSARIEKLAGAYEQDLDEYGLARIDARRTVDLDSFPYHLIYRNAGPLRQWFNEKLSIELTQRGIGGEQTINLCLPAGRGVYQDVDPANISRLIQEGLQRNPESGESSIEGQDYWRTLSFLIPAELHGEEVKSALNGANETLKREMRDDTRYLLSPRGDLLEISDEVLQRLGFRSILFKMDGRNKRDTIVTLEAGKYRYRILLDEYFALRDVESRNGVTLPSEGVFVEHAILSHLREIRCSDRVTEVGGEKGEGARRQFTSRRPHRRILPEGQNPTPEQIEYILREYNVDLVRLNREFAARNETRKVTFVSETEHVGVGSLGPVRSQAPDATKHLREILGRKTNPGSFV